MASIDWSFIKPIFPCTTATTSVQSANDVDQQAMLCEWLLLLVSAADVSDDGEDDAVYVAEDSWPPSARGRGLVQSVEAWCK